MAISRRSFISGGAAFIAAPAIVRASSLMPVRAYDDFPGPLGSVEDVRFMLVGDLDIAVGDFVHGAMTGNLGIVTGFEPNGVLVRMIDNEVPEDLFRAA